MAGRVFNIVADWDYDAGVWVATSPDVPGLVLQSTSADEIIHKARLTIPALIEIGVEPEDTIHISFRRKERGRNEQRTVPLAA